MHPLSIESYLPHRVDAIIQQLRRLAPKLRIVRTEHYPRRDDPKDKTRFSPPRQVAILEKDHGKTLSVSLWGGSQSISSAWPAIDQFVGSKEVGRELVGVLRRLAELNPMGAWLLDPIADMPAFALVPGHLVDLPEPRAQYIDDLIYDLMEVLPGVSSIRIEYGRTHSINNAPRRRPFYRFMNAEHELAAMEPPTLLNSLRQDVGAEDNNSYQIINDHRSGIWCQQIGLERDDLLAMGHTLLMFGLHLPCTELILRTTANSEAFWEQRGHANRSL